MTDFFFWDTSRRGETGETDSNKATVILSAVVFQAGNGFEYLELVFWRRLSIHFICQ